VLTAPDGRSIDVIRLLVVVAGGGAALLLVVLGAVLLLTRDRGPRDGD
jgi:hypothetical protein